MKSAKKIMFLIGNNAAIIIKISALSGSIMLQFLSKQDGQIYQ